jgi:hypothetical protein
MNMTTSRLFRRPFAVATAAAVLAGCADEGPLTPDRQPETSALFARPAVADEATAIATLRRATARYHNLDVAIAEGFILLSPCEVLPDHGPTGLLYAHLGRVMDGVINPEEPEGLLYEPSSDGRHKLVAVDLAVPYALWTDPAPPEFLGVTFQPEDEFGAWALHVWIWRHNPDGMFAPANPTVSC